MISGEKYQYRLCNATRKPTIKIPSIKVNRIMSYNRKCEFLVAYVLCYLDSYRVSALCHN